MISDYSCTLAVVFSDFFGLQTLTFYGILEIFLLDQTEMKK